MDMRHQSPSMFAVILLPFACGIWVSDSAHFAKLNLVQGYLAFLIFILLLTINSLYKTLKVYHYKHIIGLLFHFFFFSFGCWLSILHYAPGHPHYFCPIPGDFLLIKIANEPLQQNDITRFEARVLQVYPTGVNKKTTPKSKGYLGIQCTGHLLVALKTDSLHPASPRYGELYLIPAKYKTPDPPFNPGEFDFKSWLSRKHIHQQTFLRQQQLVLCGENKGNPVIRFSLALRQRQLAVYRKLIKDDEAFAVAATLLLGYRSDLSADTLSAYSKTGTIHALSVSGMHVGIIYLVIEWALQLLNRCRGLKIVKAVLILLLIWCYTVLTGCSASVLRSAIMLSAFVVAKSWNKNTNSYNILAFSAFVLLLSEPQLLWDAGFQLSYLSVFGLICLQPKIQGLLRIKWKFLEKLWSLICLSLAAQTTTFPFSIYYFHQFPVYFIISNLFIAVPMTLLMYLGILVLLLRIQWMAGIFEWLIVFTNRGLHFLSQLPYSTADGIWINKTELVLLCLFITLLISSLMARSKFQFIIATTLLLFLEVHLAYDRIILSHQQKIILFSLNRNYAIAFISADTAVVITGLKQDEKSFKFFIQPALDQLKIRHVSCIPSGRDTATSNLQIQGHQLRFKRFTILRLDKEFNSLKIAHRPLFDAVWIQHNPHLQPGDLQNEVGFKQLWIDATNTDKWMERFQQNSRSIAPIVLKKRKARVISFRIGKLRP